MEIKKETVQHVAHLARIDLEDNELEKMSHQLKDILDFIDKLKSLNVDNTNPTSHILPVNTILRDDTPAESLSIDKTLSNAPQKEGNFFVVPKVIE